MRDFRFIRVTLALSFLVLAPGLGSAVPHSTTIATDGDMSDWTFVLTNPANSARDGDGHSTDCADSTDRDCEVDKMQHDLARFAWTWDASNFYVYVERFGEAGGDEWSFVYLDSDLDGLMESGERVIILRFEGNPLSDSVEVALYVPDNPAGDPIVDAMGLTDGYDMPGQLGSSLGGLATSGRSPDESTMEVAIPWVMMLLPAQAAMNYHVALGPDRKVDRVEDNMGGLHGTVGPTGYRSVSVTSPRQASTGKDVPLLTPFTICNTGNLDARIEFRPSSSLGVTVTIWEDLNGDEVPDLYLGIDDEGDGLLDGVDDDLTAAGDPDGNGVLDTDVLEPGECVDLVLGQTFEKKHEKKTEYLRLIVEDTLDSLATGVSTTRIRIGNITFTPDRDLRAAAGEAIWFSHSVTNHLAVSKQVELKVRHEDGWDVVHYLDPNNDGNPSDADLITDVDMDGDATIGLWGGETKGVFARVTVPPGEDVGERNDFEIEAKAKDGGKGDADKVFNSLTVTEPLTLSPSYLLSDGRERHGGAGDSVYFGHLLVNGYGSEQSFDLSTLSIDGWATQLLSDPDGDGRPYDSSPLGSATVALEGAGGVFPFIVRVDLPTGLAAGVGSQVVVSASPVGNPGLTASVTDEMVVAIVRVHEDVNRTLTARVFSPCSTAHARATGLDTSSGGYRFAWRNQFGTTVRTLEVTSDVNGIVDDEFVLGAADLGDWSVLIETWDGGTGTWVELDTTPFSVLDEVRLQSLDTNEPWRNLDGDNLEAVAVLANDSPEQVFMGVAVSWVVLNEDLDAYLQSNGTFAPYTGVEFTRVSAVSALSPSGTGEAMLNIGDVTYDEVGTCVVRAYLASSCGALALAGETSFDVRDDADADGVDAPDEILFGTDPNDADTDDDGVLDGEDGFVDSDGDGAIDALDCDSDDDGLLDGLELGVWDLYPDTDPSAGCVRIDIWPATTTNPDLADTDGGGVPDGQEDLNASGRVDAGETDPNDPVDDYNVDQDGDGVVTGDELADGTDPNDTDSDDDGLTDGQEWGRDSDGDGIVDSLECDSDGDGLPDGLEAGVAAPLADTDVDAGCFQADLDPSTTTDPMLADTDGGGVLDGVEDANGDGSFGPGEFDPNDELDDDTDLDGLPNLEEDMRGTDRFDRDSDDDGMLDSEEADADTDDDGLVDALDCDSDDDGLPDGLEQSRVTIGADTRLEAACFVLDLDPATSTSPLLADSDGDGIDDGLEDASVNGLVDGVETSPLDADSDDDGLSDGEEWNLDTDGDGAPDALECDSDGDGLADGLESGLSSPPSADTNLTAGCFVADADPASTTDPRLADSDGGGIGDGTEDINGDGAVGPGEWDPNDGWDDDSDLDGLPNLSEDQRGTDRQDRDSDDDGVLDGAEPDADSDLDGSPDALSCDSDGDGLADGLERGVAVADADTDLAAGCFVADQDPLTTTDATLADTDGAGVDDGVEDENQNGSVDDKETDPNLPEDDDSDEDGVPNLTEDTLGTDRHDTDSDDDGVLDGEEYGTDSDLDGLADALSCDSDGDGLPDGLERGVTAAGTDTDLDAGCFLADADPASTTDPTLADSDLGGLVDGAEDVNSNGRLDAGERDPGAGWDDLCSLEVPAEVSELRVGRSADDVQLSWTHPGGDCVSYQVWSWTTGSPALLVSGISADEVVLDDSAPWAGSVRYFKLVAESSLSGVGPGAP